MFWLGLILGFGIAQGLNIWGSRRIQRQLQNTAIRIYRSYPTPEEIDEKIGGTD